MRITGGELAGRRLKVPKAGMRPTQDRVRESLFAALMPVLEGGRVLDLCAGTGALGLEARSRGASTVTWVEAHAATYRLLRENVEELCGSQMGGLRTVRADAARFLRMAPPEPFSLVLADPPYAGSLRSAGTGGAPRFSANAAPEDGWPALLLARLGTDGWMADGGLFVLEQGAGEPEPEHPHWQLTTERVYGITRLRIFARKSVEP